MEHVGIDLAKNKSQICILTEDGELIERRISTRCQQFARHLGERPRARILIEASTESEWVARCLEELGHEVIVADPNFAPMYAHRTRHIKTDRRDAFELAQACRLGAYRATHRVSDAQRHVRGRVAVREALVRTRARYVTLVRSLLLREGHRVASGTTRNFVQRLKAVELPDDLRVQVEPLLALMAPLNEAIAEMDAYLARRAEDDPSVRRLCTVPGVGPVTASTFVATLDDVSRFETAGQVSAYLGLVPRESSSGDKQRRGHITKAGNSRLRWLLIEAAWGILRFNKPETADLRAWAERIAGRRGRRIAAVALARKLARILFAMWRDERPFASASHALQPA